MFGQRTWVQRAKIHQPYIDPLSLLLWLLHKDSLPGLHLLFLFLVPAESQAPYSSHGTVVFLQNDISRIHYTSTASSACAVKHILLPARLLPDSSMVLCHSTMH